MQTFITESREIIRNNAVMCCNTFGPMARNSGANLAQLINLISPESNSKPSKRTEASFWALAVHLRDRRIYKIWRLCIFSVFPRKPGENNLNINFLPLTLNSHSGRQKNNRCACLTSSERMQRKQPKHFFGGFGGPNWLFFARKSLVYALFPALTSTWRCLPFAAVKNVYHCA